MTGTQLELCDTIGTETITGPAAGVTVSGGGLEPGVPGRPECHRVDLGADDHRGQATGHGGGLYNAGGTLTLTNCTVSGNSAGSNGGGLFRRWYGHADQLHRQRQLRHAAAACSTSGTATLTDSTVSGNTASASGGGVFNSARPR